MIRKAALSFGRFVLFDWQKRLLIVLAGLFLMQYVFWIEEEGLWFPETLLLVQITLVITFAWEMFTRIPTALRDILQLVTIIVIHSLVLDGEALTVSEDVSEYAIVRWLIVQYAELTPYIYFSLGAWLTYLLMLWIFQVKWRIYAATIVSVCCFAIRDSYTLLILWEQVAMILFCGLSIVVLHHMGELQRKNPEGWSYFTEYPLTFAAPTVLLVTLTIVVGSLAPDIRPLLTDPYTLWKNYRGEAVVTGGKGFVAEPTAVLEGVSGYSRNDEVLGNGFQFDYSPVMTVSTSHRAYWRGETRSLYTGQGWEQSDSEKRPQLVQAGLDRQLPKDSVFNQSQLETVEVTQTVTMLNDTKYPVLFGASEASRLEQLDVGEGNASASSLLWAPRQGELRWNERSDAYPALYTLVSQMPVIDEAGLRSSAAPPTGGLWTDYLQLPDSLPERVRELAEEITSEQTNAYDKVKQIEQYLSTNFSYTNKPDLSKGRSRDFVDRFLFEIQEGYCDYYSTAMVVMTRSLGIPARWVKGYSSGGLAIDTEEYGVPYEEINPTGAGEYTVLNADAHSWVEVYFSGYGWIPFEPTSGFVLPTLTPDDEPTDELEALAPAAEIETDAETASTSRLPELIAVMLAILVVAVVYLIRKNRIPGLRLLLRGQSPAAANMNAMVIVEFDKLLRYARRKGFHRQEHETVRETMKRWMAQSNWLQPDLEALLGLFEKAKYSREQVTEDEARRASAVIQKLREAMK